MKINVYLFSEILVLQSFILSATIVLGQNQPVLPFSIDINTKNPGKTVWLSNGRMRLQAHGQPSEINQDSYRFIYNLITGDFELTCKIVTFDSTTLYSRIGLVIREDLSPGSPQALIQMNPDRGVVFWERLEKDSSFIDKTFGKIGKEPKLLLSDSDEYGVVHLLNRVSFPVGFKIRRTKNLIQTFQLSEEGRWKKIGNTNLEFSQKVLCGIIAFSCYEGRPVFARVDSIELKPLPVSEETDRRLPSGRLVWPEPFSILNTNLIRFAAQAEDKESGIREVRFYLTYKDKTGMSISRELVGQAMNVPFEFLWDCSEIQDQRSGLLEFTCDIEDSAGNVLPMAGGIINQVTLDRNTQYKTLSFKSHRLKSQITIDGSLLDWERRDSLAFPNSDNEIKVFSQWDQNKLYFGGEVRDRRLVTWSKPGTTRNFSFYMDDEIQLFLDPLSSRSIFWEKSQVIFHFSPENLGIIHRDDFRKSWDSLAPFDTANYRVIKITDANNPDTILGYSIEFTVAWDQLGITPKPQTILGFDVVNIDRDDWKGRRVFAAWSGTEYFCSNPSEWGNLQLVKDGADSKGSHLAIFIMAALVLFALIIILKKKNIIKNNQDQNAPSFSAIAKQPVILKLEEYIQKNYEKEDLSLEMLAEEFNFNSQYLSKLFKKETKIKFSEYVNKIRMEKAKKLLSDPKKNITEVAFQVGYTNLTYFEKVFKKFYRITPKEYKRQTHSETAEN